MFLVFNKEKIQTYFVSILTVGVLIAIANMSTAQILPTSSGERALPIYNVKTEENKVALTMNCAWSADDIDRILETLEKNEVKITFFIVGEWAEKYPEAVKKIYEAGHEIGTHSNTHPHVEQLSAEKNLEEIKLGIEKLQKITGEQTRLYRTPYGEYNDTVINTARENGYYTIQWNIDTLDYKGLTGDEMWGRIKEKLQKGSIILTHNGTEHTADSLDMLLKNIKTNGYQVTTVSDLIYKDNYIIDNNGTQINKTDS